MTQTFLPFTAEVSSASAAESEHHQRITNSRRSKSYKRAIRIHQFVVIRAHPMSLYSSQPLPAIDRLYCGLSQLFRQSLDPAKVRWAEVVRKSRTVGTSTAAFIESNMAISEEIEALSCNPGVPRKSPNERKRRLPNGSS